MIVFAKYANFIDVFFSDLAFKLSKNIGINNYTIKLVNSQQLLYRPIYSLRPVELETLKAYIETTLANKFIRPSKSFTYILIFFDWKLNRSYQLCQL